MSEQNENKENNQLIAGYLLSGECLGATTVVDGQYTNNNLHIKIGETPNEVGQMIPNIENVSLYGDNMASIMEMANKNKGKHVVIAISRRPAANALRDTFMRNNILRTSSLQILQA